MTVRVLSGHCIDVLTGLPERSVHLVCTSPPYWHLRDYGTEPQAWGADADLCTANGFDGPTYHDWTDEEKESLRGKDPGPSAQAGNTVKRVCPPEQRRGQFCTACGAWRGELGLEPDITLYVTHLVDAFRAVRRVLRDDGTVWVNLGDTYASDHPQNRSGGSPWAENEGAINRAEGRTRDAGGPTDGLVAGDRCLIPYRFALAMQGDGWRLRSVIQLCKRAPMPEPVNGWRWEPCRVKVGKNKNVDLLGRGGQQQMMENPERHRGVNPDWLADYAPCPGCEKCRDNDGLVLRKGSWRPVQATEVLLQFAKSERYYGDGIAVRLPAAGATVERDRYSHVGNQKSRGLRLGDGDMTDEGITRTTAGLNRERTSDPSGRNAWDWMFWEHENSGLAHYAAYPTFIPRIAIQAGTSERGVCPHCGAPWARIVESRSLSREQLPPEHPDYRPGRYPEKSVGGPDRGQRLSETTTLGWRKTCRCPVHEPVPATVLDLFGGSGTTSLVADRLGRDAISVDLNPAYSTMAARRVRGDAPLLTRVEEAAG